MRYINEAEQVVNNEDNSNEGKENEENNNNNEDNDNEDNENEWQRSNCGTEAEQVVGGR